MSKKTITILLVLFTLFVIGCSVDTLSGSHEQSPTFEEYKKVNAFDVMNSPEKFEGKKIEAHVFPVHKSVGACGAPRPGRICPNHIKLKADILWGNENRKEALGLTLIDNEGNEIRCSPKECFNQTGLDNGREYSIKGHVRKLAVQPRNTDEFYYPQYGIVLDAHQKIGQEKTQEEIVARAQKQMKRTVGSEYEDSFIFKEIEARNEITYDVAFSVDLNDTITLTSQEIDIEASFAPVYLSYTDEGEIGFNGAPPCSKTPEVCDDEITLRTLDQALERYDETCDKGIVDVEFEYDDYNGWNWKFSTQTTGKYPSFFRIIAKDGKVTPWEC